MNMLIILNYYTMYICIKTLHFSLQMSTIHIISMTKISIFLSVINISNMVEFLYTMYTEAHIQFSLLQSRESDQVCSCWAPVVHPSLSLSYNFSMGSCYTAEPLPQLHYAFCCSSLSYNWHHESLL